MLNNFKKKRVNKSAAATMKKNATTHRAKKIEKKTQSKEKIETKGAISSSESEYSDSSDSEYEEILISNLNKTKIKEDKKKTKEELPPPLKLERQETKPQPSIASPVDIPNDSNHANHFTEEPKSKPQPSIASPIDIPKRKSKRVVIKKYYNYKPKTERNKVEKTEPKPLQQPQQQPQQQPEPRLNYLGFNTGNIKNDTRQHITNRIFNW